MAIPGIVTGPGSVVNHLPGTMRIKLIQGNDFSTTIQIGSNDIQLDGSKLFVPKDLTGCTFEIYIAGHNQRAMAKATAPVTGMVTLLIPHSMTASMHGEVAFELIEIDAAFTRRTLISGVIESRGLCETTDCGGCGQSHDSCRCKCDWCNGPRHSCGCHGDSHHSHNGSSSAPTPILVPCNPTGVISFNGKTGILTSNDVDLLANANQPGFIKPDNLTTFVDANGTLRAVGMGGGGGNGTGSSYTLPPATSTTLGGVIVGGGLKVATGGVLTAQVASSSQAGMVKPGSLLSILTDGTIDVAGIPAHTHPISEVRTLQTELDNRPVLTGGKLPSSTLPLASASAAGAVKIDGTTVVLDANGAISAVTSGALGGTVTSVGFAFDTASDAIFSVTGIPITKAGNITLALEPQPAHSVFAGPTAGGNGFPVFRSLTGDDISDATATGLSLLRATNQAAVKTALSLANVSTTGSYTDLVDKPTIPATYNLPVATTVTLGGVIVDGTTITVDANGKIKGSNSYVLPIANLTTVGGVKQGANITIDATGFISTVLPADYVLPVANATALGGVKTSSTVGVLGDGTMRVIFPTANATTLGLVRPSGNLTVIADGTLDANLTGYLTLTAADAKYALIGSGGGGSGGGNITTITGGTGITVTAGTAPVVSINSNVVTLTGLQSLSNKTLSGLKVTGSAEFGSTVASGMGIQRYELTDQVGDVYTLIEGFCGSFLDYTGSRNITITVPALSSGFNISIIQSGAGRVTLASGSGVTLRARNGLQSAGQYSLLRILSTVATGVYVVTCNYVLPVANATQVGGVKQGANTTIAPDGAISVVLPPAANLTGYLTKTAADAIYEPQGGGLQVLADAATVVWALDSSKIATLTLGGNRILGNPTGKLAGGTYLLIIKQDATGGHALSYATDYKFPSGIKPIIATTPNAVTILTFATDGVNMYGLHQGDFK